ncbi:phosphotransferase family protein [Modestobacter altitudinis]|uniref:phosphotransferase family protein n=1 Tax=Modestobacter altitudinis TaxID=2213158 RepID=UPI00148664F7|nr:aminoglycoside phosphotransferase family protein [Modestobacter altitudinis]
MPSTDALTAHLVHRGLAAAAGDLEVTALAGGVSNDVVAVRGPGLDVVVKQALGRLRVAEEWLADPARIDTEGRALRLAGQLLPGAVPEVLDLSDGYLVIERAPEDWRTWKEDLLDGAVDVGVAEQLGRALGVWQRRTAGRADVAADFGDVTAFTQLRVDPFHRTVAQRHPDLAAVIGRTVDVMAADRSCLVHGDYTPKNVLVDPSGGQPWVIDWEVAHVGDPTFDPAWTVGHLLLKTVHRPGSAAAYAAAAGAFLDALRAELAGAVSTDPDQLVRQTGCLLLARVDGKSPADYLTDDERRATRDLARRLLTDPPAALTDAWELLA